MWLEILDVLQIFNRSRWRIELLSIELSVYIIHQNSNAILDILSLFSLPF